SVRGPLSASKSRVSPRASTKLRRLSIGYWLLATGYEAQRPADFRETFNRLVLVLDSLCRYATGFRGRERGGSRRVSARRGYTVNTPFEARRIDLNLTRERRSFRLASFRVGRRDFRGPFQKTIHMKTRRSSNSSKPRFNFRPEKARPRIH